MTATSLKFFSLPISKEKQKEASFKIFLYDKSNISSCLWPSTEEGQYTRNYLLPLVTKGVSSYIENIHTDLQVLVIGDKVFPLTVNETEYDNSYVCSPYGHYISYARESIDFISQEWMFSAVDRLLKGTGRLLKGGKINKVVVVNNWLFSTNLYPSLSFQEIQQMVYFLLSHFPEHAIVFRSIDPYLSTNCYKDLEKIGFDHIANRQIFFLDPSSSFFESRLFKSDLKLLKNSGYEIVTGESLSPEEIPRLLDLYSSLYLQKYSQLNPKFTKEFIHLALEQNFLTFKALKKDGRIDGIVGFMQQYGKLYCPFFGYDLSLPKDPSLYRLLSTVLMLEAYEKGLLFHESSGASTFKKIRKAQCSIEYMAVYYKHLKVNRHLPWLMIKNFYNSIGMIYMKRY